MFQIGEFSKVARVSTRLLRYYDEIGLFSPGQIDDLTGYRFYSANQLPELNRILALKELGLSLDQIKRFVFDNINTDEIRGMLLMKKSEIENHLIDEVNRLQIVDSRLRQIEQEGVFTKMDVVIKAVPQEQVLTVREVCPGLDAGIELFFQILQLLPGKIQENKMGHFLAISHTEGFPDAEIDLEMGVLLKGKFDQEIELPDGKIMKSRILPSHESMATLVFQGSPQERHLGYGGIGTWAENNGYDIVGNEREIFLEVPRPGREHEAVTEIQLPVKKREPSLSLLS